MLKVVKSAACSWPVLTVEAKGRLIVKLLVLVEMLKILPVVPVETLVMTLAPREMVVEVPIKTFCPPLIDKPAPAVRSPSVVVPRPPLATVNGLVSVRELKVGEAVVLRSWLMLEVPETVKVLEPKDKVPVPAEIVLPFKVTAFKLVAVVVARVEVPVTNKLPLTVKAVEEAFASDELAVATMEVKEGLELRVI